MLEKVTANHADATGKRFAIIASLYNAKYVDSMLAGAEKLLNDADAETVTTVRVPGAFEIPAVASHFAHKTDPGYDAILCLGVILRGATTHAEHIGVGVTQALAQLQVLTRKPIIHEVLLLESHQQAEERCLDPEHNRGGEAAHTAVAMANLMAELG